MSTITLHHHTYYGKTWAARIIGTDAKYGYDREFCPRISDTLSTSGKTGTITFELAEDGVYQVSESALKRDIRYFVQVTGDQVTRITEDEAQALLAQ